MASWLLTASEKRQSDYVLENPNHPIAKALMFGGDRTVTGRTMNDGRALSIPAIYNAVTILAGDLSTIPLKVYVRGDDGSRKEENGHPLWDLLTLEAAPMITSAAWREATQGHTLLRGNGYTEVRSDGRGRVTELVPHSPLDVQRAGEMYKIVSENRYVHASDMLHFAGPGGNGIDGWSVIKLARENWGLASALEESNARFIANASRPSGFLTTSEAMKPETLEKIKKLWGKRNSGLDSIGGTPVLDGGFTWQQVGLSAEDTQYIESRQFSVTDIARWFNLPPHKLKDLERSTFSNIEESAIEYVRGSLRPWAVRWEQKLNTQLLTRRERKRGLYIAFNLEGLLRGDIAARTEAYRAQFDMGGLTPNELRALEDRNPIEGGDDAYVRLDMVKLQLAGELPDEPEEPDPEPEQEEEEEEGRREVRTEFRSPSDRLALRSTFTPLLMEAAGRLVRGEVRDIRRLLKRTPEDELRARIEAYYFDDLPPFAIRTMGPVFLSYSDAVWRAARAEVDSEVTFDAAAWAETYAEGFSARYAARSRRDLAEREPDAIEERLTVWTSGDSGSEARYQQVASQEAVKLGDVVARQAFVASGILSLVWRALGDTCPYCKRLDGKVIDSRANFIAAGEAFAGEDTDVPLVPKHNIGHAPAHRGCDCTIVPGEF